MSSPILLEPMKDRLLGLFRLMAITTNVTNPIKKTMATNSVVLVEDSPWYLPPHKLARNEHRTQLREVQRPGSEGETNSAGRGADQKDGLDGKSFDSFFQHQPAARDSRHVKRHDAATPIAVCIVAHHALALVLTGWPERKSLCTKLTAIGHLLCLVRLHQLER